MHNAWARHQRLEGSFQLAFSRHGQICDSRFLPPVPQKAGVS
jgi:hypothetical protein